MTFDALKFSDDFTVEEIDDFAVLDFLHLTDKVFPIFL